MYCVVLMISEFAEESKDEAAVERRGCFLAVVGGGSGDTDMHG